MRLRNNTKTVILILAAVVGGVWFAMKKGYLPNPFKKEN